MTGFAAEKLDVLRLPKRPIPRSQKQRDNVVGFPRVVEVFPYAETFGTRAPIAQEDVPAGELGVRAYLVLVNAHRPAPGPVAGYLAMLVEDYAAAPSAMSRRRSHDLSGVGSVIV